MIQDFAPTLPSSVESVMELRMTDLIRMTVQAHERRDADLVEAYEALMRTSPVNPNQPNRDSCDLVDAIVFNHQLELFAAIHAAHMQKPYWLFEALESEDDRAAQKVEKALTQRASRDGFDAALYDADWIALRDQTAPMYIGWSAKRKNIRTLRYQPLDDPEAPLITENEKQEGVEYRSVPYLEPAIERNGFEFEVMDRANFYMNPPDADDIDDASQVFTRHYWTANQLLEGIERYGFDADVIDALIELGPTGFDVRGDYQESKREVSGAEYQQPQPQEGIGYWEIFRVFGKLPVWTNGGVMEVPEHLRNDEFLWIICPGHQKILRFGYSPFQMRPFTLFRLLREPNGQGGESMPTILGALQDESTAVLRQAIDGMNIRAIPTLKRLASNAERFGVQELSVGGSILCERSLNEVEVMTWDTTGAHESLIWLADCRSRGRQFVSGEGLGNLPQKQRKNAEIEAALAGISSKFALFVSNLQGTGMERAAVIMLSHLSQFGGDEPYKMRAGAGQTIEVQPEDWKRTFWIKPRGNANDADPAVRLQKKTALAELVTNNPLIQMRAQAGDFRWAYHLLREVGTSIDENFSVESYAGEEPPPPEQTQVVAQVMGQLFGQLVGHPEVAGQAAQAFMQNPAMLKVMWEMLQQQPEQGQQGGAERNGNGQQPAAAMALNGTG